MPMTARAALHRLCELKDWSITNLEANKLLFFAHMIALGQSNGGRPLVAEQFQAWDYGPVLPSAYHYAKIFGDRPIKPLKMLFKSAASANHEFDDVFTETLEQLGSLSGPRLVAESHWSEGAWAKYYQPGARGVVIPNDAILEEYRRRVG